jgi:hypothetical protein
VKRAKRKDKTMKKLPLITMYVLTMMLLHITTHAQWRTSALDEGKRIVHERLRLRGILRTLGEDSSEEERLQEEQDFKELKSDVLFPVYYELLEEKFDDPDFVSYVMGRLFRQDGCNLASEGKREALDWAQKAVEAYKDKVYFPGHSEALLYLARKGDERDAELFSTHSDYYARIFTARIAGTNFVWLDSHGWDWPFIYPSVTNTGPQGVYVYRIIWRAWEDMGLKRTWAEAEESVTKLGELLTMVISFDKDSNPVSSVDLSKYGLSMPVIEPKPTAKDSIGTKRTVTFPHDTEGWTPPPPAKDRAAANPPSRELAGERPREPGEAAGSPPDRPWLHIAIIALAAVILGGAVLWRKTRRE